MKRILLLFLVAQSIYPVVMQEHDGVSVTLRKVPLLKRTGTLKTVPLLITVVNTKNIPLLISPASVSVPLQTLTQAFSLLLPSGIEIFNAFSTYLVCGSGSLAISIYTLIRMSRSDSIVDKIGEGILGSVGAVWLGYLAVAALTHEKISVADLESHYLYLPAVIKPSGSLDKLIWLATAEKPSILKISLFLPNNDALDFSFTAEQLEALA